jgi:glycerophosphoryl diester phosphodiesterase
LRAAEAAGVAAVEADVHLFRGRLEVRHLKTLGPLPVLWDRWKLANPFAPRLELAALLEALAPETHLMLDLKGLRRALAVRVLAEIGGRSNVTICSRNWRLLEALRAAGVQVVYSVGSRRQLRAVRRRFASQQLDGISIHERLLTRAIVGELLSLTDLVLTWPVDSLERALQLVTWGVRGLITDDPHVFAGEAPALR